MKVENLVRNLVSNVAIACIHPRILATFFDSNFVFLSNSNTLQT